MINILDHDANKCETFMFYSQLGKGLDSKKGMASVTLKSPNKWEFTSGLEKDCMT